MMVKKVPTKNSAAPKSRALHARDLGDYIAGPHAGDKDEKVEHRGSLNLLNLDHEAQVAEMGELAETARRSAQPIQHWILSWRQGEQPTARQADEAVRMFVGELGHADHQAIYALHRDTDTYHLHVAVNRVHPESEGWSPSTVGSTSRSPTERSRASSTRRVGSGRPAGGTRCSGMEI